MVPDDLVLLVMRERQRAAAQERLARAAACIRACCSPTRIDRVARALHLAPTAC